MEHGDKRRIHPEHRETVRDILARLNASAAPDDMDVPGFRLHRLNGTIPDSGRPPSAPTGA